VALASEASVLGLDQVGLAGVVWVLVWLLVERLIRFVWSQSYHFWKDLSYVVLTAVISALLCKQWILVHVLCLANNVPAGIMVLLGDKALIDQNSLILFHVGARR